MAKQQIPPVAVSLSVAAEAIGVSESTLRRWCWRGDFPHIHIGDRYVIRIAALDEWLAAHEKGSAS